ncbi:MAG: hypothetical protein E7462_03480 [Ruminococcaceae bacterium]|nr:hypothetical protein [Oscillospiraceae bacterium]
MKKIFAIIICIFVVLSLVGCQNNSEYDKIITKAIDLVLEAWTNEYKDSTLERDGTVQIKNTRLLVFQENDDGDVRYFDDVSYIVEFVIFTDYFGSAPYYVNVEKHNSVIVYKNGTMEVSDNYMRAVFGATYSYHTENIDKVIDYADKYNVTKKCK